MFARFTTLAELAAGALGARPWELLRIPPSTWRSYRTGERFPREGEASLFRRALEEALDAVLRSSPMAGRVDVHWYTINLFHAQSFFLSLSRSGTVSSLISSLAGEVFCRAVFSPGGKEGGDLNTVRAAFRKAEDPRAVLLSLLAEEEPLPFLLWCGVRGFKTLPFRATDPGVPPVFAPALIVSDLVDMREYPSALERAEAWRAEGLRPFVPSPWDLDIVLSLKCPLSFTVEPDTSSACYLLRLHASLPRRPVSSAPAAVGFARASSPNGAST
ncbi:hypothetical protein Adeg_0870 [Ammonifex degensii KC4]|uniref:Uncharacterized protein n=1 Tax=Ammonifex degensii (strain DSM 10501 / KC4) TaxID=429009 RepID=C9RCN2_AMMDK|nr:hypothetical protein [Ammonifex degensii]ACX52009.1 hypothetical protein Adeg_0870 [Ammonifex degensii KC4]